MKIVQPGDMFFNPVIKTVGQTVTDISDPRDHLERFTIIGIPGTPPDTTLWNVIVHNQFDKPGQVQNLMVGPATHILVPTAKNPNPAAPNFPENLDHFKWYPIINRVPVNVRITLQDQWGR